MSKFYGHEEAFFRSTLEATRKGKLKILEVIPSVHTNSNFLMTYYFPIAQEIKDKLKHILIRQNFMMMGSINLLDILNTFCDLLSKTDFPKLETFVFQWKTDTISLMNCEYMINSCSNYKNFKALSLVASLNIIDQGIPYEDCCRLISNLPNTDDIKALHYQQGFISDMNMLYLMHKFPKLERLSLSTSFSIPTGRRRGVSDVLTEQVLIQFFEFVLQVPKLENTLASFNDYHTANSYYRLLLVSLLKRHDVEELEIINYHSSGATIGIDTTEKQYDYDKGMVINNRAAGNRIKVKTFVHPKTDNGVFFMCLREDGLKIKSLSLKHIMLAQLPNDVDHYQDDSHPLASNIISKEDLLLPKGFWFEYVLKYCPALKELTITFPCDEIKIRDVHDLQHNDSVERLILQHYTLPQTKSTTLIRISKCLSALKFLTFDSCIHNEREVIKIILPYTALQMFTWYDKEERKNDSTTSRNTSRASRSIFYLKVTLVGSSENLYYKIKSGKRISLSEYAYQEDTLKVKYDKKILAIEIICKKIAQFRLVSKFSNSTFDINL